jgi:DNA-binding response OmpR family regulator
MSSAFSCSAGNRVLSDFRYRVLVVEDNADIARLTSLSLQHSGFDVRTLFDGHQALATARSFRPHFVLLDIGLPGMDGYQVAELLRADCDLMEMVFIAISAYSPSVHPVRSHLSLFDHFLTKPVGLDTLLSLCSSEK